MFEILTFFALVVFGVTLFKNGELRRELNAYLESDSQSKKGGLLEKQQHSKKG